MGIGDVHLLCPTDPDRRSRHERAGVTAVTELTGRLGSRRPAPLALTLAAAACWCWPCWSGWSAFSSVLGVRTVSVAGTAIS